MTPRDEVTDYLDRWLSLTGLESQAIQRSDWKELAAVQSAKASLKEPLRQSFEGWRRENPADSQPNESEAFLRAAIDRLLELEARNAEMLTLRRNDALERKRLNEQTARNLRMVRNSYAGNSRQAWQSYS